MKNILNVLPKELNKKWKILEVIRSSGETQVYKVININQNNSDNNIKIIKAINENIFDKSIYDTINKIKDIHIQNIINIIYSQNYYYILTEYLPNITYIICNGGLTGDDIFDIAIDISIALNILHKNNILHLDCTPDNIYRNIDGSYCLGDFSSAVILNNKYNHKLSGTAGFIPPEILTGNTPTFLSDEFVYSSLIYTLFNDGYPPDILYVDNISHNISQKFYSIISKGRSKKTSDRYDSINSMYNEIDEIICSDNQKEKKYLLDIKDETHPLYYLRTSNIKTQENNHVKNNNTHKKKSNQTKNNSSSAHQTKKKQKKNSIKNKNIKNVKSKKTVIKNIIFITISISILIFSYYNYVYKPEHKNELSDRELQDIIDFHDSIKDNEIFNSINNKIDISNSELSSLPDEYNKDFNCNEIKCLYANINKISSLENIKYYKSLNELYMSDNNITDLTQIEELENLKILVLSYNNINDLLPICYLTSLTNLDLSGNENLSNINELISLHNLKTLNLTNTNITKEEIEFLKVNLPKCTILY